METFGDHHQYSNVNSERNSQNRNDFKAWEMNYLEAAIFLEEGENNDKFDSHPRNRSALPAYVITHNHWFYTLDLLASTALLLLALIEKPALVYFKDIPVGVHCSIELFALGILGISSGLQLRWLGFKKFLRHKRSLLKSLLWLIMVLEAFSVVMRSANHFRVTRALRPVFLIDNRYFGGVRRFLRQVLQSLPPILEVLGLLFFFLVLFVVVGFYLFNSNEKDPYFSSFHSTFVSLYVLLTTANFPDVMMPSYSKNKWSALFFIIYLAVVLYFIMNLMLAIVFVEFSLIEKDKFRKLLFHKREACQHAFQLLISHSKPNRILYRHFQGLMYFYKPKAPKENVYLLFKVLNRSCSGSLSLKEFYGFYDALDYRWSIAENEKCPWFEDLCSPLKEICYQVLRLVEWKVFKALAYSVIVTSGVIIIVRTILLSSSGSHEGSVDLTVTWDLLSCVVFYFCEMILKLIAYGFEKYFSLGWNIFDFIIKFLALAVIIAKSFESFFYMILILRPLRLLQLFKIRRRYRDIFETSSILLPRVLSTVIVVVILYYFFAIIGMELFSGYDMKNCCVNTTVEQYYKVNNESVYSDYYYLNNFDTLLVSGVTLFELTVVNNWFIIMEAYASVSGEWSRLYFMIFYLAMMVVLSIVVAFIIEAFTFRSGYNKTFQHRSKDSEDIRAYVTLTKAELDFVYKNETDISRLQAYADVLNREGDVRYEGVRRRTKFVLQRRLYSELISSWLRDHSESASNSRPSVHPFGPSLDHFEASVENDPSMGNVSLPYLSQPENAMITNIDNINGVRRTSRENESYLCSTPSVAIENEDEPLILPSDMNLEELRGRICNCSSFCGSCDMSPEDSNDNPFFPSSIQPPTPPPPPPV